MAKIYGGTTIEGGQYMYEGTHIKRKGYNKDIFPSFKFYLKSNRVQTLK